MTWIVCLPLAVDVDSVGVLMIVQAYINVSRVALDLMDVLQA